MKVLIQTLIFCLMLVQLQAQCQQEDYIALRALYLSTDGDNWTDKTGWFNANEFMANPTIPAGTDLSTWYGVTTNTDACVTDLELYNNGLIGSIPPELGSLSDLTYLTLYNNGLSGSIPPELGGLSSLTDLVLYNNELSGSIPAELENISDLIRLDLRSNELTGNIPVELGNLSKLTHLDLSINELIGNIPPELGNLSSLTDLDLDYNQLSGSIPAVFGNLNDLVFISVNNNQLSGCYDPNLSVLCSQLTSPAFDGNTDISDGNNFDAAWEDFCAMSSGICETTDLVLAGNFNNDAIADGKDLLYLGAAYGNTGPARSNASTDWTPQYCPDWDTSVDGVNSKHQDANGDGIVDMLDFDILELNYGEIYGNNSFTYQSTDAMFVIKALEVDAMMGQIRFELHIASDAPISTHGISATIDLGTISYYDVEVDTTDSSLHPDTYILKDNGGTIDIALTRTDKNDQIIDSSIVSLVVMVDDVQSLTLPPININGGYMMSAMGELISIGGSTLHGRLDAPISLGVNHAYCTNKGAAKVYMSDGALQDCVWSVGGATTTAIDDLDIDSYSVTVSDNTGTTEVIDFDINWAFTPVEINIDSNQIRIEFEEAPLSEEVEISLDGGITYMPPTINDVDYFLGRGTYQIFIQRISDECPTYLADGLVSIIDTLPKTSSAYLVNSLGDTPQLVYILDKYGTVDISLYNIHGQQLGTLDKAASGGVEYRIDIDKGALPRGIYFIQINFISTGGKIASKVFKLLI